MWAAHRQPNETATLLTRFDYHQQLSAQLPMAKGHRVVYTKAGTTLCSAIIQQPDAVIDHKLYWGKFLMTSPRRVT